tara:strand:- start:101 stop:763 length:663 start_codon:yes stop_codon:yes gene_type:complete
MKLNTFKIISKTEDTYGTGILDNVNLSNQYCGLFRCPLEESYKLLPDLTDLFNDANDMLLNEGHNPDEWEMDLKIHMLMKDNFPCIPNIHSDNVPRVEGKTRYDLIEKNTPPMYLWLSSNPTTEFLANSWNTKGFIPETHGELAEYVRDQFSKGLGMKPAPAQTWISFDQQTPHRGTQAQENTWRVFVRLTHNSITPVRPVDNYIRRHCQVYLNPETFSW